MRYCDKCDVKIADNINHCPLCGRDVSQKTDETKQECLCYPDNKIWQSKRDAVLSFLFWFLLIGCAISIAVELLVLHKFEYNWYVLTGALILMLDVIAPLKFRWSFVAVSLVVGISICLYLLFLELFTATFGWGLYYAIPFFMLFMTIYSIFVIFLRNYYKGYEFVICLMTFSILSLTVFLYNYISNGVFWPSLVAFLASISCFVFFLIFRFRRVKQELTKSFFM